VETRCPRRVNIRHISNRVVLYQRISECPIFFPDSL
jgi:hypothetical protein